MVGSRLPGSVHFRINIASFIYLQLDKKNLMANFNIPEALLVMMYNFLLIFYDYP